MQIFVWVVFSAGLLGFDIQTEAQAETIIRLGHLFPTTHFEHKGAIKLQELIDTETNGKAKLEIFPASQLGNEKEMTEQVRSGALQITIGGGAIQQFVPEMQMNGLPGLWKGHDHFAHVLDSPVGEELRQMAEKKNIGLKVLGYTTTGIRHFMHRRKAISNTAEFEGVKIRVDNQPASAAIWRAVKANPVVIAFPEVYSALQTGVIDAAEQPACGTIAMKFYEQAKYHTLTGHQLTVMAFIVNQKWWDGLPAELSGQLKAAVAGYLPYRNQLAKDADEGCIAKIKELGGTVIQLKDIEVFRKALRPIQKEFGDKYGVNDLIAEIIAMN
jgi:tripartite ATP-independent transporter DctP family solute receptor